MKIQLLCAGKESGLNIKSGIEEFTRRINHYYPVEWKFIPTIKKSGGLPGNELKTKESNWVLKNIKKEDFLVALDEQGTMFSSVALSAWMQARSNESLKQLIFLIGGAYGLDKSIIKRANFIWSLSPLTFPHQLTRLILVEQIYRACTIIKNEKYHHV